MSRLDDLMSSAMERHASASGLFGDRLTLYNFADENADTSDAPDWEKDDGTEIEGHVDWSNRETEIVETPGGEEVRADAILYISTDYDVRDGRVSDERASVVEDPEGNEFRVEQRRAESGVYRCAAALRETFTDE